MPRVAQRPKDDELVVCIESFAITAANGEEYTIPRGYRLRPSHPAVLRLPERFKPWLTTPDDELENLRRGLYLDRRP
jgi:hypothetical protein